MTDNTIDPASRSASVLRRWAPLIVLGALMAFAFLMGWHKYLSFKTIGLNYDAMKEFVGHNMVVALLVYVLAYIAFTALSLPGGLVMTITGGLLFGWQIGAPAAIVGATIGACALFMIVRTSFGKSLAGQAGPFVAKLRDGFRENALSYLLFLGSCRLFHSLSSIWCRDCSACRCARSRSALSLGSSRRRSPIRWPGPVSAA